FDIDDSGFVNISGSNPMTFGSTVGIDLSYVTNNGSYLEAQQDIEDFAIKVPNIEIGVSGFIPVVHYYVNGVERSIEFVTEFSAYSIGNVNSGDHITLELTFRGQGAPVPQATFNVQGNVVTYATKAVKINWNEALIELKIKDFIKEMMMQKSVIAVADAYEKHIKFLSVDDRLSAEIVDLSDIFAEKQSENYKYGNYAQNNYLKHKYDDDEQNYADGTIVVDDENLTVEQDLYQGIGYAPLKSPQTITINAPDFNSINNPTKIEVPIFNMYDIEAREESGNIKLNYKPLDKRFYFHEVEKFPYTSIWINGQSVSNWAGAIPQIWENTVRDEYWQIRRIINTAKVFTVK